MMYAIDGKNECNTDDVLTGVHVCLPMLRELSRAVSDRDRPRELCCCQAVSVTRMSTTNIGQQTNKQSNTLLKRYRASHRLARCCYRSKR